MTPKRSGLGKGLNALLNNSGGNNESLGGYQAPTKALEGVSEIAIHLIEANPFQPRKRFNEEELQELVESITIHGLIQPVTLRSMNDGTYQLISGERRTRAAKIAGLSRIPAYVRLADDQSMLEMALVENTHRQDLNPLEVAISYKRLLEECKINHEELASRVGKNRSTVTNFLRLLDLSDDVQVALRDGIITAGHARTLVGLEPEVQKQLLRKLIEEHTSVRDLEVLASMAKLGSVGKGKTAGSSTKGGLPIKYKSLQQNFTHSFGRNVSLQLGKAGRGKLVIPFTSEEDLQRLSNMISKLSS